MAYNGFVQDVELDSRLILNNYSYYIPMTTGDDDTSSSVYQILYGVGDFFFEHGITDVLFAPPFKTPEDDTYNDGYNVVDRYDVGEFDQEGMIRTKYGTKDDLRKCIRLFRRNGIRSICNINCNSVAFNVKTVMECSSCDMFGSTSNTTNENLLNFLYYCNAAGGGLGQSKYGLLNSWDKTTYFNGTVPQGQGLYRVMVDSKLQPYYYDSADSTKNNIPSWLNLANGDVPQTVNNYFVIDGYYTTKSGSIIYYANVYNDPRSGVVTQSWASYKIENGTTSTIADWIAAQPGYNSTSEGTAEFFVFVVKGTQEITSNNKIIMQYPYDTDCITGEFLKGIDVNNTNTTVQSETLNWIKWVLDLGFNGLMYEAADFFNYNILINAAQYMSDTYGNKLNDHISLIKTQNANDSLEFEQIANYNGQLVYDVSQYNNFTVIKEPGTSSPLSASFTGSIAWDQRVSASSSVASNWSYVSDPDIEETTLAGIPTPTKLKNSDDFSIAIGKLAILDQDRRRTTKLYTPYNIVMCYAIILTNSYTTPSVFYGDLWRSDLSYMSTKTYYYPYISKLLKLRSRYCYGGQNIIFHQSNTSATPGYDLVSSTRYGFDTETGLIAVFSNNTAVETTITVYAGIIHAGQTYKNVFSCVGETAVVNSNGYISLLIVGISSAYIYGHLSIWVPVLDPSVY